MRNADQKPHAGDCARAIALALVALASPLIAAAAPAQGAAPADRPEQTIQRIRTEDAGSRIDELRVGGQTQSITVQPKIGDNTPAYEVKPANSARSTLPTGPSGATTGPRVWNVLKF